MTDIKQAARWLDDGHSVRCESWDNDIPNWKKTWDARIEFDSEPLYGVEDSLLEVEDLLAEDWVIADDEV